MQIRRLRRYLVAIPIIVYGTNVFFPYGARAQGSCDEYIKAIKANIKESQSISKGKADILMGLAQAEIKAAKTGKCEGLERLDEGLTLDDKENLESRTK